MLRRPRDLQRYPNALPESSNGAQRVPRHPKGTQKVVKGSQMDPKGPQRHPKSLPKDPKGTPKTLKKSTLKRSRTQGP